MSLAKARLLLRDIETIDEPSLAFNRQIQSTSDNAQAVVIKPIKTALQQGNTSGIGKELSFTIKKGVIFLYLIFLINHCLLGAGGFGFSYASRLNAEYINLFYVKTIKPDGPSNGLLKIGDRLLKVGSLAFIAFGNYSWNFRLTEPIYHLFSNSMLKPC